jgi:tetratricopeptide (TPR) repeat protein
MAAKKKTATPPPAPAALSTGSRSVLIALAMFVLLRGAAGMVAPDGARLWGLDFFGTLPASWRTLLAWLPLLFLLPPVARLFLGKEVEGGGAVSGRTRAATRPLLALLLTAAAGLLAWQVNVGYAFLGDGTWYPAELLRSMTVPGYENSMIKPSAWMTGQLLDAVAQGFRPDDIRMPFVLAGVLGMLAASAGVFFLTLRERGSTVLLLALLLLAATGSLVFFGYIELYAIVYGLSISYLTAAWMSMRGLLPVWLPGVLLLTALLFGASAVVWLPSYLLLLHWKYRGEAGAFPLRRAAWLLMLLPPLAVALLYVLGGSGDSAYIVALSPYERIVDGLSTGWQNYVLTASARWMDIVNVLFLTLGGVMTLLPVLLFLAARRGLLAQPAVLLGLTAAAGGLTLLVFGNTFLGLARDWDVAAFAVLGCLLLAAVLFKSLHAHGVLQLSVVLPGLTAVLLSQFLLWLAVNVDEEASAARFEQIARMDEGLILPMNSFTAWENLRKFHRSGGDRERYFHAMRRLIATGYRRDVSYAEYLSAVLQLSDAGRRRAEMSWLFATLQADASAPAPLLPAAPPRFYREFAMRVLLSAWQVGERDLAARFLPSFEKEFSSWSERALLLPLQKDLTAEEARVLLDTAVTDSTRDAFLLMTAGGISARYGLFNRAERLYDRALEREPTSYPSWYLVAARLQLEQLGNTARGREYLSRCIEHAPSSTEARQARDMLDRLP